MGAAGLQFGKEFFIIGKDVIVDLAVIFFLEFLDDFRIEVISPAKNVEDTAFFFFCFLSAAAAGSSKEEKGQDEGKKGAEFFIAYSFRVSWRLFICKSWLTTTRETVTSIIQVERALICGEMPRLTMA